MFIRTVPRALFIALAVCLIVSLSHAADVILGWNASPGATNYRLHSGISSGVYSQITELGNTTSTLLSNLTVGQTYYFAVSAYNATGGESPLSNEISYIGGAATPTPTPTPTPTATPAPTPTPTATPVAPSGLSAAVASSSRINLSWTDNSTNESGFKIECSINGSAFTQITTVGANTITYSNTGLTASTKYSYRIRAYNSLGNSSYSNTASATTAPSATPTPTPSLTPTPTPTPSATPIITISASPTSVHEGGIAIFTITTSAPNPNSPITVNYAMTGKAIYGTHYTLSNPNGTITIPAGASSANVRLRALVTGLTRKSEKATMALQSSSNYKLPKSKSLKKATVTIQNIYP